MAFLRIYGFFLVYFAVVFSVHATDTCVKQSACVCLFPNGTGIDLTPAAAANFSSADTYNYVATGSAKYVLATYYYHPCYDVKLSDLINVKVPLANNTCTEPSSICRHVNTMTLVKETLKTFELDDGVLDFMGKSSVSIFSDQGDSIVYANGPSQTTVLLRCAQITENQLEVYSTVDPRNVILAFYSPDACLKQIEASGRSFGSTLLIIFLSFVIFYLVLGICTKKFLMGATGIEVIPNLGFWSELPNLVRDGWLFMTNGFKLPARASGQTVSPDPNSYDSI